MIFTSTEWVQLIMNGAVMPALVIVLFQTLMKSHKNEINAHKEDKKLLQEQLKEQAGIMETLANGNTRIALTLEKMDMRLENLEKRKDKNL